MCAREITPAASRIFNKDGRFPKSIHPWLDGVEGRARNFVSAFRGKEVIADDVRYCHWHTDGSFRPRGLFYGFLVRFEPMSTRIDIALETIPDAPELGEKELGIVLSSFIVRELAHVSMNNTPIQRMWNRHCTGDVYREQMEALAARNSLLSDATLGLWNLVRSMPERILLSRKAELAKALCEGLASLSMLEFLKSVEMQIPGPECDPVVRYAEAVRGIFETSRGKSWGLIEDVIPRNIDAARWISWRQARKLRFMDFAAGEDGAAGRNQCGVQSR